jgi:hypothetical protein
MDQRIRAGAGAQIFGPREGGTMVRKRVHVAGLVSLLALASIATARADAPIGAVAEPKTKNAVAVSAAGGPERELRYQTAVYQNDTVITRDLGTALQFTDQSLLTVSSNSKVVLDSFVFDASSGTLDGTVKLGVGVFRLVSGALVKHDNLHLLTPVTTLTIRGTDLLVSVETDGTTRLHLYEGSIRVKTCNGTSIWMRAGQRIVVNPTCTAFVQSADSDKTVADAGGDPSNTADPNNSGGDPGDPGDPGSTDGHTNHSGGGDGTNPGGHGNANGSNNPGNSNH